LEWGFQRLVGSRRAPALNDYQRAFCTWNAQRLGLSADESRRRFESSLRTFRGGHAGLPFRTFNDLSHSVHSVFATDKPEEVYRAYELHAPTHFLRQLSHAEPAWPATNPVVAALHDRTTVTIADFGCGLAQTSISLAKQLRADGVTPTLVLADIPTLRFEFLAWLVKEWGFEAQMYPCTIEDPRPALPACDVLVAREFFEHIYDPVGYAEYFDRSVQTGGFLVTNVADHHAEFMHVSPDLAPLRQRLVELGYVDVARHRILQKR
jgi:hypothetical protein